MTGLTGTAVAADLAGWRGTDLHFLVMVNPAVQRLVAASAGR
jgi:hypothetical protein